MAAHKVGKKFILANYNLEDMGGFGSEAELLKAAKNDDYDPDDFYEITITKVFDLRNDYRLVEKSAVKKTVPKKKVK